MKFFKNRLYDHPKGCAPLALRQLTDAPDNDIMSACIHNGYDPERGGMLPLGFRDAALQLGVCLSTYAEPREPMCLGELAEMSARNHITFVAGVRDHVLVVKNGDVLDAVKTPRWEMVDMVAVADIPGVEFDKR